MLLLGTLDEAKGKVWLDARALIEQLRTLCADSVSNVGDAIALLMHLREETAEDINQIQHEHLILVAVEWLIEHQVCAPNTLWHWNPVRQAARMSRTCVVPTPAAPFCPRR